MDSNPNDIYMRGAGFALAHALDASLLPIERPASGFRVLVSGERWTRVELFPRPYNITVLSESGVFLNINSAVTPAVPADVDFNIQSNQSSECEFLLLRPGDPPIPVDASVGGYTPLIYLRCSPGVADQIVQILPQQLFRGRG